MPHDMTPAHKLDFVPVGDAPLTADGAASDSPAPELPKPASRTAVPANEVRFGLWDK
jgi:hypothetical protein